ESDSKVASMVFSGIVLTVFGPASSDTYKVGAYSGFFTPVDAHSGRCRLVPSGKSEAFSNSARYKAYACCALATPALPRSASASSEPIFSKRLSLSTYTRETKKDTTERILEMYK